MFFRRTTPNHRYCFVAVTEIEDISDEGNLYGQRTYRLTLADGSREVVTCEDEDWRAWSASITKGGLVINA